MDISNDSYEKNSLNLINGGSEIKIEPKIRVKTWATMEKIMVNRFCQMSVTDFNTFVYGFLESPYFQKGAQPENINLLENKTLNDLRLKLQRLLTFRRFDSQSTSDNLAKLVIQNKCFRKFYQESLTKLSVIDDKSNENYFNQDTSPNKQKISLSNKVEPKVDPQIQQNKKLTNSDKHSIEESSDKFHSERTNETHPGESIRLPDKIYQDRLQNSIRINFIPLVEINKILVNFDRNKMGEVWLEMSEHGYLSREGYQYLLTLSESDWSEAISQFCQLVDKDDSALQVLANLLFNNQINIYSNSPTTIQENYSNDVNFDNQSRLSRIKVPERSASPNIIRRSKPTGTILPLIRKNQNLPVKLSKIKQPKVSKVPKMNKVSSRKAVTVKATEGDSLSLPTGRAKETGKVTLIKDETVIVEALGGKDLNIKTCQSKTGGRIWPDLTLLGRPSTRHSLVWEEKITEAQKILECRLTSRDRRKIGYFIGLSDQEICQFENGSHRIPHFLSTRILIIRAMDVLKKENLKNFPPNNSEVRNLNKWLQKVADLMEVPLGSYQEIHLMKGLNGFPNNSLDSFQSKFPPIIVE